MSPERATNEATGVRILKKLLAMDKLSSFVVDEAHCMSTWGHDFRPSYKSIAFALKNVLEKVSVENRRGKHYFRCPSWL